MRDLVIDYRAVSVRLMISGSFVLTVLLPALTPASAQGVDWGGIMQTEAMNSVVEEIAQQQAADVARRDVSQPLQEKGQEASETDLSYSSSPTRTSRNLRIFLDRSKASNPALADDLEQLFSAVDVVGEVGKAMRGYGLSPDNVADAYAVWWISAWSAANGVETTDDPAIYQAVKMQARAAFAATPDFAKLPDADRQQFAEASIIQAVLLDTANDGMRGTNPQGMAALAANARKGAKDMGIDLDTLVLTREGFRPR